MQPTKIVLLDMLTAISTPVSLNTWKVRLVLNFLKIQYTTKWVLTKDIESTCKSLGLPPTGVKPNGEPHYTVPAIIDYTQSSTNPVLMADSTPIIEYLTRTYLSPSGDLFPHSTRSFHALFEHFIASNIYKHAFSLWLMDLYRIKLPEDQLSFRERMERLFKKRLEDIEPQGAERDKVWAQVQSGFETLALAMAKNEEGSYVMGNQISFSDFALCSILLFIKNVSPESWARVSQWNNGRWASFEQSFREWQYVDYPLSSH